MRSIWCVALLKWVINGHTGVSILLNELGGKRSKADIARDQLNVRFTSESGRGSARL